MIQKFMYYVDKTSEWTGRIACWIIVPMVLGTVYDVIMRYAFKAPTRWAYEMTWMEYGTLFMLGGSYGLLHQLHVRVDVLYRQYSKKVKLWFDAILYLLLFIPLFIILIKSSTTFAADAWEIWEVSSISYWQPYIWPVKTVMPVAFILMFLQGVSELIKIAARLKRGGEDA